jgi:hypothetical protein
MKRAYLTMLLMLCGLFANAQTFGATKIDTKGAYNGKNPVYGTWLKSGANDATMKFEKNAAGLEMAMKTVERMLLDNQRSVDNADFVSDVRGKDLGNSKDPATLNKSIQSGNSKVNMGWKVPDGSTLQLLLSKDSYEVNVLNAFK